MKCTESCTMDEREKVHRQRDKRQKKNNFELYSIRLKLCRCNGIPNAVSAVRLCPKQQWTAQSVHHREKNGNETKKDHFKSVSSRICLFQLHASPLSDVICRLECSHLKWLSFRFMLFFSRTFLVHYLMQWQYSSPCNCVQIEVNQWDCLSNGANTNCSQFCRVRD